MSIEKATVERDNDGFWTHSDFPEWDECTTKDEYETWCAQNSVSLEAVLMNGDAPDDVIDLYFEHGEYGCAKWNPTPPSENAFLVSIHDTEDGPVAVYAIPSAA